MWLLSMLAWGGTPPTPQCPEGSMWLTDHCQVSDCAPTDAPECTVEATYSCPDPTHDIVDGACEPRVCPEGSVVDATGCRELSYCEGWMEGVTSTPCGRNQVEPCDTKGSWVDGKARGEQIAQACMDDWNSVGLSKAETTKRWCEGWASVCSDRLEHGDSAKCPKDKKFVIEHSVMPILYGGGHDVTKGPFAAGAKACKLPRPGVYDE